MDKSEAQILIQYLLDKKQSPLPFWEAWLQREDIRDLSLVGPEIHPKVQLLVTDVETLSLWTERTEMAGKICILVDRDWTTAKLKKWQCSIHRLLFLDESQSTVEQNRILDQALNLAEERRQFTQMTRQIREQNLKIDELNRGLEDLVQERTVHETEGRLASRKNVTRVREIIGFIRDMAQVADLTELLPLIRRQVKEHHSLGPPILFIPKGEGFGDLYEMRGMQTVRMRVRTPWEASPRLRTHELSDSQFLANATGRPVGKALRMPLMTLRHQQDVARSPLIFFEHGLSVNEIEPLLIWLLERLQPVSWALDRLVLEQELNSTSRDWEMTFDELSEPIAIIDKAGSVLRSNSHWRKEFLKPYLEKAKAFRSEHRQFTVESHPLFMNDEKEPVSYIVYLRDESKALKLKSQAIQVEKMAAIGQLAGHIAHELNNPLTGLRSLAQVLVLDAPEGSQLAGDLTEVEKAAARCQAIINNLLEFSSGRLDKRVELLDLNEIAKRTLPFLKSATSQFRSDINLSEEKLMVRAEPQLLQQVIFNLVNNACQAMRDRGEIEVRTRKSEAFAVLEVRDSGPGIEPHLHQQIFEPFFTTKAEGEGTGLGLSLSRDFVRQFGGELDFESKLGSGTVFRVSLPLSGER